jgi:SAM-dependent methyltransferase
MTPYAYDERYFSIMRGSEHYGGDADGSPLFGKFLQLLGDLPLDRMRILDVGCGRGELLALLHKSRATDLFGLDFAPAAVKATRELLARRCGPGFEERVLLASITERQTFPERQFDLILLTDVVEHLPQPILEEGLANVRHWLKDDGQVFLHTFPTLGPHRIYQTFLRLRRAHDKLAWSRTWHCNVQTRRRLRRTLERAGLHCRRMWLENDILVTSNVYETLGPGEKRLAKTVLENVIGAEPVRTILTRVELAEYVAPSIYCLCTKAPA